MSRQIARSLKEIESVTTFEERLSLILLIEGQKPGALVMGVERQEREDMRRFAERTGLEIEIIDAGSRSLIDRLLGRDTRAFRDTAFFAREEERFDVLKEDTPGFAGYTDESVGRFLGYPETALDYYSGTDVPGADFREVLEGLDRTGEQLRYLNFLSYVPAPEKESIDKAIQEGRDRAEHLRERSEQVQIYDRYRQKALEKDVI